MYIFYYIPLSSVQNENFFRQNCMENQNTHFIFSNFLNKIVSLMRYVVNIGRRWQYGTWASHAGYLRLQTHYQNM